MSVVLCLQINSCMNTVHVLTFPMTPNNNFPFELPMAFNPKCDFMVTRSYKMFVFCFKVSFIFDFMYLFAYVGMTI